MSTERRKKHGQFTSSWGFVLSAVGSAVGMANVWGFPAKMGSNGGGAFLIAYLLFILLFGTVGLSAEYAVGRRAHTGTLGSYRMAWASRKESLSRAGGVLGWLPLAGSMCIAIGYAVIIAYVLKAFYSSVTGSLMTADTAAWFDSFSLADYSVVPFHAIVVVGTLLTLLLGARSIEKSNKVMMPLFFIIFLILAVRRGLPLYVLLPVGGTAGSHGVDLGDGTGLFLPVHHRKRHDCIRRVSPPGGGRGVSGQADGPV